MVSSKPKLTTLFSVGVFLLLAYGVFFYVLSGITDIRKLEFVSMLLLGSSGAIALTITIKTLTGIKITEISKEKFTINYPFRFKKVKFTGRDLEFWKIDKIKTFGGVYEEIQWNTKAGKQYSISKQEHTDYDKARNYMLKKFKKIQKR